MANQRTFLAQGLVCNGIALGGTSRISFSPRFKGILRSRADGQIGSEDVNRVGLGIDVSIETDDVTKVNAALDATPGNTTFSVKESGSANYHHYKITAASQHNAIVLTGMRVSFPKNDYARLTLSGRVRFANAAHVLADVLKIDSINTTPPSLTAPVRLYRGNSANFDVYPLDSPESIPLHLESADLSMDAVVIEDSSDADIGTTAVDIVGWNPLQVTLTHRDAKNSGAVPAGTVSAKLLGYTQGELQFQLLESRGGGNYVVAVQNLLWTGADQDEGEDYSLFKMSGEAGWRRMYDPYDVLTMNGDDKLFSIELPT